MLNALVTLSSLLLLTASLAALWQMLRADADKILAALEGRSLRSQVALETRPVSVRYLPRQVPSRVPVRMAATLRAAA